MKKVEEVRFWLRQGIGIKEAAQRAGCSLSLAYQAKGRSEIAKLRHGLAVLKQEVQELRERVGRLEAGHKEMPRMLSRTLNR
jgi:cell division protein FtsB